MPSDLFQVLPIAGAPEKPNLVFFFDEAHWLFGDAPKVAVDRVEQVARLIRHCFGLSLVTTGAAHQKYAKTGTATLGPSARPYGFRTLVVILFDSPAGVETCVYDGFIAAAQARDVTRGAAHHPNLHLAKSGLLFLCAPTRNGNAKSVSRKPLCDPTLASQRPSGLARLKVEKLSDTVRRHRGRQPADTIHRLCHRPGAVEHVKIGFCVCFGLFVQRARSGDKHQGIGHRRPGLVAPLRRKEHKACQQRHTQRCHGAACHFERAQAAFAHLAAQSRHDCVAARLHPFTPFA